MNVLIIDAHLGTRQAIEAIVRDYCRATEPTIVMAADGSHAMNLIVHGAFDVIITSNQLRCCFGANLLQAINRGENSPLTLLHSTHATGYMLTANNSQEKIDLASHVALFDFARFKVKDLDFSYIKPLLMDANILGAIAPHSK